VPVSAIVQMQRSLGSRPALRSRDSRRESVAGWSRCGLPRVALRRSIVTINTSSPRVPMSNTRNISPLLSAIAGGTVLRAEGGLLSRGRSDMASPTVSFPIYRGLTR
jgi:hypothetical protein